MRESLAPVQRNAVPGNSRGLRPLPPTPKRDVVAQRILHCGKRNTQALYWYLLPDSFQMWFETTRFVYFVKLKHVSRTFFNLKLQRTAFQSKNTPKKCPQSSPRAPKTSPKCLRELPGDVLRGHTHLQSGPGASPIRQSGKSVITWRTQTPAVRKPPYNVWVWHGHHG